MEAMRQSQLRLGATRLHIVWDAQRTLRVTLTNQMPEAALSPLPDGIRLQALLAAQAALPLDDPLQDELGWLVMTARSAWLADVAWEDRRPPEATGNVTPLRRSDQSMK